MFYLYMIYSFKFCTTSDNFRLAQIQEHVLPLHDPFKFYTTSVSVAYIRSELPPTWKHSKDPSLPFMLESR
jgi:hypothetical protein